MNVLTPRDFFSSASCLLILFVSATCIAQKEALCAVGYQGLVVGQLEAGYSSLHDHNEKVVCITFLPADSQIA